MKRFLLILSLFICSLGLMAQEKFVTDVVMEKVADNIVSLSWECPSATQNTIFHIYRTEIKEGLSSEILVRQVYAAEITGEDENGNPILGEVAESWKVSIYGLDLTSQTGYKFSIAVLEGSSENPKLPVYMAGGNADKIYYFTYGLKWTNEPLTNQKSSSVTLNWEPLLPAGEYVYTVFGVDHNVALSTTTQTTITLKNLETEVEHHFVVRAYDKNGGYLATTEPQRYFAQRVDCVTFTSVAAETTKKETTITLEILGYDDDGEPFQNDVNAYNLTNGSNEPTNKEITREGKFIFKFKEVDFGKEFKLVTYKIESKQVGDATEDIEVKAIGIFTFNEDGTYNTQYCDIELDLRATHVTQHTVTLQWGDPGFVATQALLTVKEKETGKIVVENKVINHQINIYAMDGLEDGTEYEFEVRLNDGYNYTKASVKAKTKVASICEIENITAGSTLIGCGSGKFVVPYNLEFYTEYEDGKVYAVIRFKPLSAEQVNSVSLLYTTDRNALAFVNSLKTTSMTKGDEGWYVCRLYELDKIIGRSEPITDGMGIYFTVMVKPNKACSSWSLSNFYATKAVSYKVGTGCQDDAVAKRISFTKLYPEQTQFTLQSNGRLASVGVFPNDSYNENERIFYNSFDDAPSSFTLDIKDYAPGTYYLHIHDVYGEAEDATFKCIWAIY